MALRFNFPTLTSELLNRRMLRQQISIRELATKTEMTYEHVRKITKGDIVPSRSMVQSLADALGIKRSELEEAATKDRIRLKFGKMVVCDNDKLVLFDKDPQLEPLERQWKRLSPENKAIAFTAILALMQALEKSQHKEGKKH